MSNNQKLLELYRWELLHCAHARRVLLLPDERRRFLALLGLRRTRVTSQARELSYIRSREITHATFCQGPCEERAWYRDFMGWEMPWYSAQDWLDTLLLERRVGMMHIVCYLRQGSNIFETYWTTRRGVEAMDNSYRFLDLTVWGRPEAGYSEDLGTGRR